MFVDQKLGFGLPPKPGGGVPWLRLSQAEVQRKKQKTEGSGALVLEASARPTSSSFHRVDRHCASPWSVCDVFFLLVVMRLASTLLSSSGNVQLGPCKAQSLGPPKSAGSLDLCCGRGFHAFFSAARVVVCDTNPSFIQCSCFNCFRQG